MKRIITIVVLLAAVGMLNRTAAQDKAPVQFSFTAERTNDSLVTLSVKAIAEKGTQLFSVKKQSEDDAFISAIHFDSAKTAKYVRSGDIPVEKGQQQVVKDAGLEAELHFFTDSVTFQYPLHVAATDTAVIRGTFDWLARKGEEFPSGSESFSVKVLPAPAASAATTGTEAGDEGRGVLTTFLLSLLAGLAAVITPCVFPLLPVTVSFFLKKSENRGAAIRSATTYSLSIILIYTIPTLILIMLFGQDILYKISTSLTANLLFFAIFIVFAISFFGAFELTLPSSWATKADAKAGKGGLIGTFFMALTLVIVSFSCTGPFVGSLLAQTSKEGIGLAPILGMLGFSIGLAMPFTLFALFPSMLKSLPRSGGWLNSVKIVFGFIELALGLKFLSNADLIQGWHLLDREVYLALWIVLAVLLGMYLLGKISFSHDSPMPHVSVPRLFLAISSFAFAMYLVPGMWGAPLKAMSGILPPATTQDFDLNQLQYKIGSGGGSHSTAAATSAAKPPQKLVNELHVPYGLVAYFDLQEGLEAARALNKPVMLDFTGHSCANCRKMENSIWSDPEVLKIMKEDFVLISLYVDHYAVELPDEEKYTNKDGKKITNVGDRNLDYEITKFGFNAQPLYMFLDLKEEPLSTYKYGYEGTAKDFVAHLEKVKAEFAKRSGK